MAGPSHKIALTCAAKGHVKAAKTAIPSLKAKGRGVKFAPHNQTCQIWQMAIMSEQVIWVMQSKWPATKRGYNIGKKHYCSGNYLRFLGGVTGLFDDL